MQAAMTNCDVYIWKLPNVLVEDDLLIVKATVNGNGKYRKCFYSS